MDRRSWPWRKKSSERILGSNEFLESAPAHITKHLDEQTIITRHQMEFCSNDGAAQWQQTEEKAKQVKEPLSVALLDATAKEILIKQHAKVAEEAVSGWERAEVEAKNLKQELESVMQQKLATEDRVFHLEGSLNDCMQQLRHVREEQEAKIHNVTIKGLKDSENIQAELEEKLVDMEQKYLDSCAENKHISRLLQERAMIISEISEARSCAEANLNVVQIRLEAMEREHNAVRFECSNLKRELEIRNEEKASSRRSAEAVSKQQLEDARKIAKLEGNYHRLGAGTAGKKLSSLGGPLQTKLEADSSRLKHDDNKKKLGKGNLRGREEVTKMNNKLQEETPNGGKDIDALLDRLSAMEDETRRLKELLARRDNELQHSRLMCARTASKLSSLEEQFECLLHDKGLLKNAGISALDKHIEAARSLTISCEPSLASASEDGNDDCSHAWASALISELAHFKTQKVASSQDGLDIPKVLSETKPSVSLARDHVNILEKKLTHEEELHAAHHLCDHVSDKLRSAEEDLATMPIESAATQSSLSVVQCQLDAILQAQDNGDDLAIVLDHVREVMGIPHQRKGLYERTSDGYQSDLAAAVKKLADVVEKLGFILWAPGLFSCKIEDIDAKLREFNAGTELVLQGSAGILQFLKDLASILDDLMKMKARERDMVESYKREEQACPVGYKSSPDFLEQQATRLEEELRKAQGEKIALETHMRMEFKRFESLHNEVAQLQENKAELECLLEAVKNELIQSRVKLNQAEQVESNLLNKLSSAEASLQLIQHQLQSLSSSRTEVVSQLEATKVEQAHMQDSKDILERESLEKNEKIAGLEAKCQELTRQLSECVCSRYNSGNGQAKASEEQEIAVKLAECQQTISFLGKQLKAFIPSREQSDGTYNQSIDMVEAYQVPHQYKFSRSVSELPLETQGLLEVNSGTSTYYRQSRMQTHARKEMECEPQRDSNASDTLDSELMSLSKSGRPLLELFGDITPAHEHYIRAVEQLTSSSEDECVMSRKLEPSMNTKNAMKPPLSKKKKIPQSYSGVDMSKSMDDTSCEKLKTFGRLFSRAKNS